MTSLITGILKLLGIGSSGGGFGGVVNNVLGGSNHAFALIVGGYLVSNGDKTINLGSVSYITLALFLAGFYAVFEIARRTQPAPLYRAPSSGDYPREWPPQ